MAPRAGLTVELRGKAAVGLWRNDRFDPRPGWCRAQPVGIERSVSKKLATGQPSDRRPCAAQIMGLPRQQPKVGQVAKRIGQSHDLGRYPSATAPDGLSLTSPFAPCPWP